MGRRLTIDEYYWAKINKEGPKPEHVPELGGCWLWTGALYRLGYGHAYLLGKQQLAHRIAWILAFGEIPQGMLVCHRCDVRNCVNPEHLFLGTHKDNTRDMLRKGRAPKAETTWARQHPELLPRGDDSWARKNPDLVAKGDTHVGTKVPDAALPTIFARRAEGESHKAIAKDYGVAPATISHILNRRTRKWFHNGID